MCPSATWAKLNSRSVMPVWFAMFPIMMKSGTTRSGKESIPDVIRCITMVSEIPSAR